MCPPKPLVFEDLTCIALSGFGVQHKHTDPSTPWHMGGSTFYLLHGIQSYIPERAFHTAREDAQGNTHPNHNEVPPDTHSD
jgi:hypothetical protein